MLTRFLSLRKSPCPEVCRPTDQTRTFRPHLERLEEREVPSANPLDALLGSAPGLLPIQINSLTNGFVNSAGQLQYSAQGQIGVNPFSVPVTLSATPGANGTQVLDLSINPIHLDLLGLNVQTSQICLDITAQPGPGNLLGNLLSQVGSLLDTNGGNPASILSNPVNNLLTSLATSALLDGALNAVTAPSSLGASSAAANDNVLPTGANDILHLSLGPVDLNLLGLNVSLDNCNDGPVVVDVYTEPGLLGNLLNSISNLLNPSQNNLGAEQLLGNIANEVFTSI